MSKAKSRARGFEFILSARDQWSNIEPDFA